MKLHFMPCLGAALVDIDEGQVVSRFFSYAAQPEGKTWEDRALEEFWLKPENLAWYTEVLENLKRNPPSRELAIAAFLEWVVRQCDAYGADNITLLFDTAGFDYAWLSAHLPAGMSPDYLFGRYRGPRDMSSFHMGLAQNALTTEWGAEEAAFVHLGVEPPQLDVVHDHHPDNDAAFNGLTAAYIERARRAYLQRIGRSVWA